MKVEGDDTEACVVTETLEAMCNRSPIRLAGVVGQVTKVHFSARDTCRIDLVPGVVEYL